MNTKDVTLVDIKPSQNVEALCTGKVAGRNGWVAQHPKLIKRVLQSLSQADDYLTNHPAEAKAVIQKRLNYEDSCIANVWP